MCTMTWLNGDDGYELFFNRDEKRTRQPATPPEIKTRNHVRHLAPTDTDAGGTWIGVNEFGMSVCVLNHSPLPMPAEPDNARSRGLLADVLLGEITSIAMGKRIRDEPLSDFRPFIIVAVDAQMAITTFTWDGSRLLQEARAAGALPLTTSSCDSPGVLNYRHKMFQRLVAAPSAITSDMLMSFHRQHDPDAGAYSVCMKREDACTLSFSHIVVDCDRVAFEYTQRAPCEVPYDPDVRLRLARKALP
ncbi:MAG: NRDE family protein [Verrucomicrobia bacterium]|nr:NRDE family protein [Verrucomicrobiota bacterium]